MTTKQITVLVDMRWPPHTGIGLVLEAYLAHLPDDISIVDLKVPGAIGHPLSPLRVSKSLRRAGLRDAVFWNPGFIPPLFEGNRSIVFVHDLTHLRFYNRLRRIYYNFFLRPLYQRCAAVVCVSEYTRTEFLHWSGMDPSKVHALHNGVSREFIDNREALLPEYKYVFYPGNHRPYKNIVRLIEAYAKSDLGCRGIHLLLTGSAEGAEVAAIKSLGVKDWVHYCGRVSARDMPKYYRGATAVAFISLYEGFGLPILEAMASDVPVLTSSISAMPEVAGNAALIVDPYSIDAIADALVDITSNESLRRSLIELGRQRVAAFDWEYSAKRFWSMVRALSRKNVDSLTADMQTIHFHE